MTNKVRDLILSVIILAFGIVMIVFARDIPHKIASDVGSAYVPTFIGICLVIVAAAKLLLTLFRPGKYADKKIEMDQDLFGGIGTIVLMFAYMMVLQPVGFILSSIVYLFLQMLLLSDNTNRKPVLFAVISVAVPVVVSALFYYAIKMPLPKGILGF